MVIEESGLEYRDYTLSKSAVFATEGVIVEIKLSYVLKFL